MVYETLSSILPDGVEMKELASFRNNRHRTRYQTVRRAGLPVGSGVIETACKTLVTQRMKQSGMRSEKKAAKPS
jgi:hypothetical protein